MLFRLGLAMKMASNVQIRVAQMLLLLILHELVFDKLNVSANLKPFAKALPSILKNQEEFGELVPGLFGCEFPIALVIKIGNFS